MESEKTWVIIGNWGMNYKKEGYGLTVCEYQNDGTIMPVESYLPDIRAGKMILDRQRNVIYCVDEKTKLPEFDHVTGGGKIYAISIDEETGELSEFNHQFSYAPLPCAVCYDSIKQKIIVVNHSGGEPIISAKRGTDGRYEMSFGYSDASVVLYPVMTDGALDHPCDIYKIFGHGILPMQSMPHLHSVVKSPRYDFYFVCDKGKNEIYTFEILGNSLNLCSTCRVVEGSAPRNGCVVSDKPLYICNYEEYGEVTSFVYTEKGEMRQMCSLNILPEEYDPFLKKQSSDLILSADEKYLYNVTRGINYISVIKLDKNSGEMKLLQNVHFDATTFCGGGARAMSISPDNRYLFVCVTDDGDIHRFAIKKDGTLDEKDIVFHIGNPASMVFYKTFV